MFEANPSPNSPTMNQFNNRDTVLSNIFWLKDKLNKNSSLTINSG